MLSNNSVDRDLQPDHKFSTNFYDEHSRCCQLSSVHMQGTYPLIIGLSFDNDKNKTCEML